MRWQLGLQLVSSAALVLLFALVLNGHHHIFLLKVHSGGDDVRVATKSAQAVSVGCQAAQVRMVLVSEHHPDLSGQSLQEQSSEEDAVVLVGWAELPHVGQQFLRLSAAEGLHRQQQLHPPKSVSL